MSELGLNEHHQLQVGDFMRFERYLKGQRLKAVDKAFEDVKSSRLFEEMYTIDEVTDLLDSLHAVTRGDIESELMNASHTMALLLTQLFEQAEKWHLKLDVNLSELENRDLLEKISDFESQEYKIKMDPVPLPNMSPKHKKLEPLNEAGGAALLHMEIERLKDELEKCTERQRMLETQIVSHLTEKSRLVAELEDTKCQLGDALGRQVPEVRPQEVEDLQQEISSIRLEMQKEMTSNAADKQSLESDLISTKHRLLALQEKLEMAEKEVEKKFNQTAAYTNMRKMLQKKNDIVKELRKKLVRYEPAEDDVVLD